MYIPLKLLQYTLRITVLENYFTLVGDTSRLSFEPQGITQKGLQIACALTIYFKNVICKLAEPLRTRALSDKTDAHDSVSPSVDSLSTKLKHNPSKQKGQYFVSPTNTATWMMPRGAKEQKTMITPWHF